MKDIEQIFEIDEHRLDKEWLRQPKIFFEWSQKVVEAKEKVERAKARLNIVRAELDQKIRSKPEEYNLSKVTESSVQNLIILQDDYQEAEKAVIKTKHDLDVYQSVIESLDHRKKALENAVHLYVAGWFASPRTPKGATKDDVEQVTKPRNSRAYRKESK